MNDQTGAQRPAITRKFPWIAVAAILLVLGLGAAAYSASTDHWFGMGPDNVMGMMPPNGMVSAPGHQPKEGGAPQTDSAPGSAAPCGPSGDIVLPPGSQGTFKYVSTKHDCTYTIKRDGTPWVTVTYDMSARTYRLTDPHGTGKLLLELGVRPGLFTPAPLPNPYNVKKNPN
jgi:hypothetical protein